MCSSRDENRLSHAGCLPESSSFSGRAFPGAGFLRPTTFPADKLAGAIFGNGKKRAFGQDIFESLLAELQATHKIDWYRALVDSASLRAPCGGEKTGPNPTDRRKLGSKHHLLTDANGIPLSIILTEANRHDVTQLLPLLDKVPHVKGKRGAPRFRPDHVEGDRAYDSEQHRKAIKKRG